MGSVSSRQGGAADGKEGRKSDDDDEEEPCSRAAQAAAASRAGAVAVLFVHEGGRIDTELPSTFGLANREDLDENFNTTTTTAFHFVHAGGECNSKDHDLGSQPSAAACAAGARRSRLSVLHLRPRQQIWAVLPRADRPADCSEGFEDDSYDFYRIAAGYSPTPLAAPLLLVSRATAAAWLQPTRRAITRLSRSPPYSAPVQLGDGSPHVGFARTNEMRQFAFYVPYAAEVHAVVSVQYGDCELFLSSDGQPPTATHHLVARYHNALHQRARLRPHDDGACAQCEMLIGVYAWRSCAFTITASLEETTPSHSRGRRDATR